MKQIKYTSGYKYQLEDTYTGKLFEKYTDCDFEWVKIYEDGTKIYIKKGYAWDGPSGPTIDTSSFMRGSLIHDAIYQLMRLEKLHKKYKQTADIELKKICIEDDMNSFRANYVWWAVDKFGEPSSNPKSKKKIIIAP